MVNLSWLLNYFKRVSPKFSRLPCYVFCTFVLLKNTNTNPHVNMLSWASLWVALTWKDESMFSQHPSSNGSPITPENHSLLILAIFVLKNWNVHFLKFLTQKKTELTESALILRVRLHLGWKGFHVFNLKPEEHSHTRKMFIKFASDTWIVYELCPTLDANWKSSVCMSEIQFDYIRLM